MSQIWYRLADGKVVPVEVNEKVVELFQELSDTNGGLLYRSGGTKASSD